MGIRIEYLRSSHFFFYSWRIFRPRLFRGGAWFICVICQSKSQLSALEGETTVLWHPWPFHHALPSHAFCIHNAAAAKTHWSSTPTPAPLSPAALFVYTTIFPALLLYHAVCCQTQIQGRLFEDNMTDLLFIICLAPQVELHVHLDGAIRVQTILDVAK